MKTRILIVAICCLLVCLCACSSMAAFVQLPETDYVLLVITDTNQGQNNITEDYWSETTYTLTSKGKLEKKITYNLSGSTVITKTLNEEQLKDIIATLNRSIFIDTEEILDGNIWNITYYDADGTVIKEFHGDLHKHTSAKNVVDKIKSHFGSDTLLLYSQQSIYDETEVTKSANVYFYVKHNGDCEIQVDQDGSTVLSTICTLSQEDLELIKNEMAAQQDETAEEIRAESVWEFKYCDIKGECIKRFRGSIIDYENLQNIATVLSRHVDLDNLPQYTFD